MNLARIIDTLKKHELYQNEQNLDSLITFKNFCLHQWF